MPPTPTDDHHIWLAAAVNGTDEDPEVDQISLSLAHPNASKLIPSDEFLLDVTPLCEDIGSDVFAFFRYWMKYGRPGNSSLVFLEVVLVQYDTRDDKKRMFHSR